LASGDDRVPELVAKLKALEEFRSTSQFNDLYTAYERAANLAAKADAIRYHQDAFTPADQEFFQALSTFKETAVRQLADGLYADVLTTFAEFRPVVDKFFDQVMIMDKDEKVRENRLSMLIETATTFRAYADFRAIVVSM